MSKISETILSKLSEFESAPKCLFAFTENCRYPSSKIKYKKTQFVHFDKALYFWDLNFFGGKRYIAVKAELEISADFAKWIKRFRPVTKEDLVAQLLNEERDVLQIRCERDGKDWVAVEKSIKKELFSCFKNLKNHDIATR